MKRLAGLITCALFLALSVSLGGCAGCEPNPCNEPNQCNQPNPCNQPNACNQPNPCNTPCGGSAAYGVSPVTPRVTEGGSGWR